MFFLRFYGGSMESSFKNRKIALSIVLAAICAIATSAVSDTAIYSNTNDSGYVLPLPAGEEVIDYGRTNNGGTVTRLKFGFAADTHYPGSVKIRFYTGTNYYSKGSLLATLQVSLPYVSNTDNWYEREYSIPASQQFTLPSGAFGYSLEFSGSYNYAVYANGGLGNEAYFWMYVQDLWDWSWSWERVSANSSANAGLYMQVFAKPVEYCNFSGYKYEDKDNDGQKDADESGLQGWTIYVDTNNNDKFDQNEPNSITNANGYYSINNVPVPSIDSLREVMKGGWEATKPENGEWNLWTWSGTNNLNFHNKKVGDGMISGYKFNDANANGEWNNGEPPLQGWRIYVDQNKNGQFENTEPNDITDPNGFYEITGLNAPAEYTVAEVMQTGWNQTLPGGEGTYLISTEPNTPVENINFGNTTQPVITEVTISGRVTTYDGFGLEGVKISLGYGFEFFDVYTDENGNYQAQVAIGSDIMIIPSKEGWRMSISAFIPNISRDHYSGFIAYLPYTGGDGTEESPYLIATPMDLFMVSRQARDWDNHFKLIADLDMSDYTGTEFRPIGSTDWPYKGVFDGNGYTISNFTHETSEQTTEIGLFGVINDPSAEVKNLGMIDPVVTSNSATGINRIGSLAGNITQGKIENCYAQNCVVSSMTNHVGGLVGTSYATISNCYTTGNIIGHDEVGGLIGSQINNDGLTIDCYSEANVTGNNDTGGLVGNIYLGQITGCSSNSLVSGNNNTGGLVGYVRATVFESYSLGTVIGNGTTGGLAGILRGTISSCFSKSDVTVNHSSGIYSGGLVGTIYSGTVKNCYSAGSVTEDDAIVGGLVGQYTCSCYIINCYSVAKLSYPVGGLVASNDGCLSPQECIDSFWDKEVSTARFSKHGIGKTTAQMMRMATFANWDFENTWRICDGFNYPKLAWEPKIPGDISCPDGVGLEDLAELASQWQLIKLQSDLKANGMVDMKDWSVIAAKWQTNSEQPGYDLLCDIAPEGGDGVINGDDLAVIASDWLSPSAHSADIAPEGGDGQVGIEDLIVIAENWLEGR